MSWTTVIRPVARSRLRTVPLGNHVSGIHAVDTSYMARYSRCVRPRTVLARERIATILPNVITEFRVRNPRCSTINWRSWPALASPLFTARHPSGTAAIVTRSFSFRRWFFCHSPAYRSYYRHWFLRTFSPFFSTDARFAAVVAQVFVVRAL